MWQVSGASGRVNAALLLGIAIAVGLVPELSFAHALLAAGLRGLIRARDFPDFWLAGRLAHAGDAATLFDPASFQTWYDRAVPGNTAERLWSYPPSMALAVLPFGFPGLGGAWVVWFGLGTACLLASLFVVVGRARFGLIALLVLLSPAYWDNLLVGQNALWTGSLTVLGFGLIGGRRRCAQGIAGAALGALSVKPQLGLLGPVVVLALRRWRALAVAALVAVLLAGGAALVIGADSWPLFFAKVAPAMRARLLHPYQPLAYQALMGSPFIGAESLGIGQRAAFAVQGAVSLAAVVLAARLASREAPGPEPAPGQGNWGPRAALGCAALALVASPFVLDYDALGATALLLAAWVRGALPARPGLLLLAAVAIAQPGWGLALSLGAHVPVFTWIAWLGIGIAMAFA